MHCANHTKKRVKSKSNPKSISKSNPNLKSKLKSKLRSKPKDVQNWRDGSRLYRPAGVAHGNFDIGPVRLEAVFQDNLRTTAELALIDTSLNVHPLSQRGEWRRRRPRR